MNKTRLTSEFYNKECVDLAIALLGKVLCRRLSDNFIVSGYIVETEAYLGFEDKSAHSYNGRRTNRNEAMFMPPGTCYVYITYGMYHCLNVSSLGEGCAVLLRALEPLNGIDRMSELRSQGKKKTSPKMIPLKDLCNGPAKLCISLDVKKENIDKQDLCTSNDIWIEHPDYDSAIFNTDITNNIVKSPRIGIESAGEEWSKKLLRFYIKDNAFVSKKDKNAVPLE